jgi:hypothetical protein
MPAATITVHPDGADPLRIEGEIESTETEAGWRLEMRLGAQQSWDVPSVQVVGEAADVALGEMHYGGQVTEYHPSEGRIVVEGHGPAPAWAVAAASKGPRRSKPLRAVR